MDNTLHSYTFEYYGWIPGYNDFDTDWITIQAESPAHAWERFNARVRFAKTATISTVDGVPFQNQTA